MFCSSSGLNGYFLLQPFICKHIAENPTRRSGPVHNPSGRLNCIPVSFFNGCKDGSHACKYSVPIHRSPVIQEYRYILLQV